MKTIRYGLFNGIMVGEGENKCFGRVQTSKHSCPLHICLQSLIHIYVYMVHIDDEQISHVLLFRLVEARE